MSKLELIIQLTKIAIALVGLFFLGIISAKLL